jgi:hypothetical protein
MTNETIAIAMMLGLMFLVLALIKDTKIKQTH